MPKKLPQSLTLLELISLTEGYSIQSIEHLPFEKNWELSRKSENAAWPRVALGIFAGNKPCELTFSAERDGIHGVIAGTTGSGKSELLLTLILNLAVRYDPSILNFMLIDYQGGVTFEPLRKLPHCIDVVTSMQGMAGMRSFLALRAELHRRSRILAAVHVKNVIDYRRKNLHVTGEPLPHLFVVIDEFAEMIRDIPEAGRHLDSIARLGRALGVHLILATQRPSGIVSDQIRANMGFRICLRVQSPEDSQSLLHTTEAAALSADTPGRGYLQTSGATTALIQTAYSGNAYLASSSDALDAPPVYEVLIEHLATLAEAHRPGKPWPDPLPKTIALNKCDTPLSPELCAWLTGQGNWSKSPWENDTFSVNIGLIDDPAQARQYPLALDLARGHSLILGTPGSGKTTLLRTIMLNLAASYAPNALQMYLLDFGERGLRPLRDLPHIGAYITISEGERIRRLLHRLTQLIEERKLLLSDAQVDTLNQYNAAHPHNAIPSIVVVIDNFAEFREAFHDADNVINALLQVIRTGRVLNIHFIITTRASSELPHQGYRLFARESIFFLGNTIMTDYYQPSSQLLRNYQRLQAAVNYHEQDVTLIHGRGFIYVEGIPLEFHAAIPVANDQPDRTVDIINVINTLRDGWDGELPGGIDILPSKIFLKHLLPEQVVDNIPTIVGLSDTNLEPAMINLRTDAPHFIVVGPPRSGKTTVLRTLIMSLCHCNPVKHTALVLVDFRQRLFNYGGQRTLSDLPHVLGTATTPAELREILDALKAEYRAPVHSNRDVFVIIDNYDDLQHMMIGSPTIVGLTQSSVARNGSLQAEMGELARYYGSEGLHFVLGGPLTILRGGSDELLKQVNLSRYGIGLDADDAPTALGGRVGLHMSRYSTSYSSYFDTNTRFPPGRGFIIKSGHASLTQIASPAENDNLSGSLDNWISEIIARNPHRAYWYGE